jgi:CheY-like chemotaxis protein
MQGQAKHTRLSILVVDDDHDMVDSFAMLLENMGHDVRRAYEARTALALSLERAPDVVFLDAAMPRIDGYTLARELRALPGMKRSALICLSAYGREEDVQRAKEAGCARHLLKPVAIEEIQRLLEEFAKPKACSGG